MNKSEIQHLKQDLKDLADDICRLHKLASMLDKFCKGNINNDDLYEVSYIAELLEKKLNTLGYNFFVIIEKNNKSKTLDDVLDRIQILKATENLEVIVED